MSRLTVMLGIVGIVGLPLTLGGCAGAMLVGALAGAAGGGYAAAQERGVDGAVSDLQIETKLESAFAAADPGLNEGITTTVYQGRVLLAGTVATPQMKASAAEIASHVSGIKALYDDVELAPRRAAWDAGKDAWITAQMRSELMLAPDIRSGIARARNPHRAVHPRGQAGRLLCRATPRCTGRGTAHAGGHTRWVEPAEAIASGLLNTAIRPTNSSRVPGTDREPFAVLLRKPAAGTH